MNNEQQMSTIRKLFKEVYNQGNLSLLDNLCVDNIKLYNQSISNSIKGLSAIKKHEMQYQTAFPNKNATIDDIFAAEDRVVVQWTCRGVHKGKMKDMPATGKQFTISGINIYHFSNGKISEIHEFWDRLSLFEQLGLIQPNEAYQFRS